MWQPIQLDDSITNIEGGSVRVPEGYYLLEISSAQPTAEDYNREFPGIYFKLRIAEGAGGVGRTLNYFATLKPEAQFGLGRILYAAGVEIKGFKGMRFETWGTFSEFVNRLGSALNGRKLGAHVGDDTYNGKVYSTVVELFSVDEYNKRKELVASNPVPQVAAPMPVAAGTVTAGVPVAAASVNSGSKLANDLDALLGGGNV